MRPPLVSCATSQKVMPAFGNRSEIGMKAEPMMPKACSMPCICRTFTKASSVVIRIANPRSVLSALFGSSADTGADPVAGSSGARAAEEPGEGSNSPFGAGTLAPLRGRGHLGAPLIGLRGEDGGVDGDEGAGDDQHGDRPGAGDREKRGREHRHEAADD